MNVLIVGASLIGSQVARVLVENGQRPVLFDKAHQHSAIADIVDLASVDIEIGDILRPLELVSVAQKYEITDIVHLAANPMLTAGAQSNPYAAIELNVMGTTNILEVARQLQLHRVVMASSSAVIESLDGGGDVDSGDEEAFPRPMTFYGATKQVAENLGLNYARAFDLDFVGLRFASVAGPWRGAGGGVPSTIFREALCAAIAGENVEISHRVLEWLYVKDAATATWLALQSTDLKSRIFNISMGESISPYDFRDAMIKVFPECVIEMKDQEKAPSGSAKGGLLNLRRAFEELEYSPTYNMTEAIRDCAEFYKNL